MSWTKTKPPRHDREESNQTSEEPDEIEAMLRLYGHLRDEILVSIRFQNRVILGEAVVVGLIYGIRLTSRSTPDSMSEYPMATNSASESLLLLAAMVLPPVIIISTALWTVEQTRMMRIGNYLELLENRINSELGDACLTWENWLRSGNVSYVGTIHHSAKTIGYVGFFLVLGLLGLFLYVEQVLVTQWTGFFSTIKGIQWMSLEGIILAIYVSFFVFILTMTLPIITYRTSSGSRYIERMPSGQQWSFEADDDDQTTSGGGSSEEETMTDGGPDQGGATNEQDSHAVDPEWTKRHSEFRKWEYCYQTHVLDVPPNEALDNADLQEQPNVNISRADGMISFVRSMYK